jgi:phospholipid-binding lipoprotein MlaA
MLGKAVDFVIDPAWLFVPTPLVWLSYGASVGTTVGDRGRYSETVDSILFDSADGYAQAQLLYLQNRRFELGQTATTDSFEDPYAE